MTSKPSAISAAAASKVAAMSGIQEGRRAQHLQLDQVPAPGLARQAQGAHGVVAVWQPAVLGR
jgi:hypothetical protein